MIENKNNEITNKAIKIESFQKEIKSNQSKIKKSEKIDQQRKNYIETAIQTSMEQHRKKNQKTTQTDMVENPQAKGLGDLEKKL